MVCRRSPPGQANWLEALPTNRPWVYVSQGTLHNQSPYLLRAAAEGLVDLPVQVIMTTGGRDQADELGPGALAGNVRVERWAPESELIPRVAVVVTAGGASTVMGALQAG